MLLPILQIKLFLEGNNLIKNGLKMDFHKQTLKNRLIFLLKKEFQFILTT